MSEYSEKGRAKRRDFYKKITFPRGSVGRPGYNPGGKTESIHLTLPTDILSRYRAAAEYMSKNTGSRWTPQAMILQALQVVDLMPGDEYARRIAEIHAKNVQKVRGPA